MSTKKLENHVILTVMVEGYHYSQEYTAEPCTESVEYKKQRNGLPCKACLAKVADALEHANNAIEAQKFREPIL